MAEYLKDWKEITSFVQFMFIALGAVTKLFAYQKTEQGHV